MKSKIVAKEYGIDADQFEIWVAGTNYKTKISFMTGECEIHDSQDIPSVVEHFKHDMLAAEKLRAEEAKNADKAQQDAEIEAKNKQQTMASMLITSGFSFEGYSIKKYSGYISGDDVVQIDRGSGGWFSQATDVGESLMQSLVHIRRNALMELKEAAYDLGCNAVIGVDFDYLTMDPETVNASGGTLYMPYVFGVTANGNAVVIEKQ